MHTALDSKKYSVKEKEKTEREKETEVYYLINRIIVKDNFFSLS